MTEQLKQLHCLALTNKPRGIMVRNRWSRELSSRKIDANTDLYELLITEAANYIQIGWKVDSDIGRSFSSFFVVRGDARLFVTIMPKENAPGPRTPNPYR